MKQAFCCKFLRFSQWSNWEFQSSGMWCRITGNFLDVWNECDAFVLKGRLALWFSTCGHHVLGDEGNSWLLNACNHLLTDSFTSQQTGILKSLVLGVHTNVIFMFFYVF